MLFVIISDENEKYIINKFTNSPNLFLDRNASVH